MKQFDDFEKLLSEHSSFLLIGHEDPDGDSLGSLLGMSEYLEGRGKRALAVCKTQVPKIFYFLSGIEKIESDFKIEDFEAVILLDNGDLKRTGFMDVVRSARKQGISIVNIDHHIRNDIWKLATLNLADVEASSTSEIVFNLLTYLGYEMTSSAATALLAGMYYDTGGFHHTNTSNEVLRISSELLHLGANLKKISKSVSQNRSVNMLKLWGIAIDRIIVDNKRGMAVTFLTRDDILQAGANDEEISGLVNLLNTASEIRVALLLYETSDGKIKGSLRTEDENVDVAKIAELMGGGGHKKASGFALSGKFVRESEGWKIV